MTYDSAHPDDGSNQNKTHSTGKHYTMELFLNVQTISCESADVVTVLILPVEPIVTVHTAVSCTSRCDSRDTK